MSAQSRRARDRASHSPRVTPQASTPSHRHLAHGTLRAPEGEPSSQSSTTITARSAQIRPSKTSRTAITSPCDHSIVRHLSDLRHDHRCILHGATRPGWNAAAGARVARAPVARSPVAKRAARGARFQVALRRDDDDVRRWARRDRARVRGARPARRTRPSWGSCSRRVRVQAVVVVAGGVLADRRRKLVLVGASLLQGAAQAATAVVGAHRRHPLARRAQRLGDRRRPRHAGRDRADPADGQPRAPPAGERAQGLSRNGVRIGPAVGGVSSSRLTRAGAGGRRGELLRVRRPAGQDPDPAQARGEAATTFVEDLREGWREFWAPHLVWSTVILIGLGNVFFVRRGARSGDRQGAARRRRCVGAIRGRRRRCDHRRAGRVAPSTARPLFASTLAAIPQVAQLILLAFHAPVLVLAATTLIGQIGLAIGITLWFTVFQQNIPGNVQSRVSSYDTLGLVRDHPARDGGVGPIAARIGQEETLLIAAGELHRLHGPDGSTSVRACDPAEAVARTSSSLLRPAIKPRTGDLLAVLRHHQPRASPARSKRMVASIQPGEAVGRLRARTRSAAGRGTHQEMASVALDMIG